MSIGKLFLAALIGDKSVSALFELGAVEHLFREHELPYWKFFNNHLKTYATFPAFETIEAHMPDPLPTAVEPPKYYHDLLVARWTEDHLKRSMATASNLLAPGNKSAAGSLKVLSDCVMELTMQRQLETVEDFRFAKQSVISNYVKAFTEEGKDSVLLGWPTLDEMTGGLKVGDFLSMVGRPAAGKTWQMLYSAYYDWLRTALLALQGVMVKPQSRLFVSMEMDRMQIKHRLSALHAHIPVQKLTTSSLSTFYLEKLKDDLTQIEGFGAPFWIVNGNLAATVEDIWNLAKFLRPDMIVIDGAYLLKHPTERDRYKRAAENAELIKKELTPLCPVMASWQFAKSANKKKKGEYADMDDIGYTDAIAQVSSLVLGLLQHESVETLMQRLIRILKGRNGEVGEFITAWDFIQMNFAEYVNQPVAELQYI